MENIGNNIIQYRKKLNLTQKDLGDMLNVSPQAVSKWENGQAEPDTSTIKKLCQIFKISTDELLGLEEPAEVAATTAEQNVQPVRQIVEQKIISGYCERCKKPVSPNEYVVTGGRGVQRIYCNECNEKRLRAERVSAYYDYKRQNKRSFIFGPIIGLGVAALFCMLLIFGAKVEPSYVAWIVSAVVLVCYTAFGIQMFWDDSTVSDMFFLFFKSFKMPGVIFTLDLDGLLFLLFVKIGGAILGAILSVIIFLLGLIITPVASIMILPFAIIKRCYQGKKLKEAAQ